MIDSHCHLDVEAFSHDLSEVIARASHAGVVGMLIPAIAPSSWQHLADLQQRWQTFGVRAAFGLHPQATPELTVGERACTSADRLHEELARISMYVKSIGGDPIVAIGECGLDGGTPEFDVQEQLFRSQLRVARDLRLPVVIHVLRAHHRAPQILREERVFENGGIMHSYSGGADLVPIYRDLGLAFSFAGPVTYRNSRRPLAAAKVVPDDLLLVETDAPDQAPEPRRGSRCEPADIAATVAALAHARGTTESELAQLTMRNTLRILPQWNTQQRATVHEP